MNFNFAYSLSDFRHTPLVNYEIYCYFSLFSRLYTRKSVNFRSLPLDF